jgi:hypothetical protein
MLPQTSYNILIIVSLGNFSTHDSGLPGFRFCRKLVGLPYGPVKEDHKVFHVDVEAEKFGKTLGTCAQQVTEKIAGTGFLGGLIVGLALPLIWMHRAR